MVKKVFLSFAAGALGGMVYSICLWVLSDYGVFKQLDVAISLHLSSGWLYSRIVWGGMWGFLFLLPLWRSRLLLRGLMLSLFPTAVQLLYVYPVMQHKGLLGLELGTLTPLVILGVTFIWGLVTSMALRLAR